MDIRVAELSDGPAISTFLNGLIIPARIPVTVSRGSDCFALGRLRGGESFWLLAENDEGIQAALEVACVPMRWQHGGLVTMAYAGFGGVAPNWRRRGLLRLLGDAVEPIARRMGCTIGAYLRSRTNTPAAHALDSLERRAVAAEPIHVSVLPASRRLRADSGLRCEPASPRDLVQAAELVRRRVGGFALAPAEDPEQVLARLRVPDDLRWVARDGNGRVLACVAAVDASEFRPMTLGRLTARESMVRWAINQAAPLLGTAVFPDQGQHIRLACAFAPAAVDARSLGQLVRALLSYLVDKGFHGMLVAMPGDDPLRTELAPWWSLTNVTLPTLIPGDTEAERALRSQKRPSLYLEYALH